MNPIAIVLYFLHVIISLFLIMVVLLQQGKGADLAVFGGGGTQAAFGARGAANILHRFTVVGFVLFIVTTLSIGILQARQSSSTVMSGVAVEETTDDAATDTAPPAAETPDAGATDAATPAAAGDDAATDATGAAVDGAAAADATGEDASSVVPPEGDENPQ